MAFLHPQTHFGANGPDGGLSLLRTPFPLRGKTCSLHSHCNTLAAPLLSPHIFPKAQKKDA